MRNDARFQPVRSAFEIVGLLKSCASQKDLSRGSKIHAYILEHTHLGNDSYVSNTLVNMYAKCGALSTAQQVLKELRVRSVVTWNTLIAGYAQQGQGWEALKCFDSMQSEGHSPDVVTFTCALKACGSVGEIAKGEEIHEKIASLGMLEKDIVLASSLVDMYARCGVLAKAQQVLEGIPMRNTVTWNAIIAGYSQQGQGEKVLELFNIMQCEGHSPDAVTFTCTLKACGNTGAAAKGEQIHNEIAILGMLKKNIVLANTLVDMYAKSGALAKAQQVLEGLPVRNVVTWNALMVGYAQKEQGEAALKCFSDMQCEGLSPDVISFTCALKACGSLGEVAKGEEIHHKIMSLGMLDRNVELGNALVDMYARCGSLAKAQQVLEGLHIRNVVTWNAQIAGYTQHGQGEEALKCFDYMQCEGHSPDAVTFISVLKACGRIGAAAKGKEIHDNIVSLGMLEKNVVLGSTLVDMYARCGALAKAQEILEGLSVRDGVMWNALIAGYAQQGQGEKALKCFERMQHDGHYPDVVTFSCALGACGSIRAAAQGEEIHDKIVSLGMLEKDNVLGSTLVDMYVKCGALSKAQQVLEGLSVRDAVVWNALIAGYVQQGQGEEALRCFDNMQREGHSPDGVTFICALRACGSIGNLPKGEQIHDMIASLGMLEKDIVLGNTLVDLYARCGALVKAQQVLERLPVRDVVTWNTLIAGYCQMGQGKEMLKCFDSMQHEGHCPDGITLTSALKACGSIGATGKGVQIHNKIASLGMLEKDNQIGNALVDMYARCGKLAKAQEVLEGLPFQDVVTWNALITGYAQQGQGEEALKCFDSMRCKGQSPNVVTFSCVLKACGSIGAASKGKQIHDMILSLGLLEKDIVLGGALVVMYVKCGALKQAIEVFKKLPVQDTVSWNAVIGGYAEQGQSLEAFNWFESMQCMEVKPDLITLICVLNACSHSGLLDQAEMFFSAMSEKYGLMPDAEHFCCMVDLFGRARKFTRALMMIEKMSCAEFLPVWVALLGACCKWGELKIGRLAIERAFHLDKSNGPGKVHFFLGDDIQHAQTDHISATLKDLASRMLQEGCLPGILE